MTSLLTGTIQLADLPAEFGKLDRIFGQTKSSRNLASLVERERDNLQIDYEVQAVEFNRAYFMRNYLKCLHYLRSFATNPIAIEDHVLDLGGGAGPFSLAARHCSPQLETILIDRSPSQLRLAADLSGSAGLHHVSRTRDLDVLASRLDESLMRIASYWVCENRSGLRQSPNVALSALGKRCIVLDYPHVVAQVVDLVISLGGRARHVVLAQPRVCSQLIAILGQGTITYGGAYIEFDH